MSCWLVLTCPRTAGDWADLLVSLEGGRRAVNSLQREFGLSFFVYLGRVCFACLQVSVSLYFSRSSVTSQCIFYTFCVASSVCGKRYFTGSAFTTLITIYSVCSHNRDRSPTCPFHYYLSTIKSAFIVNRPRTPLPKPHPHVPFSFLRTVMYTPVCQPNH